MAVTKSGRGLLFVSSGMYSRPGACGTNGEGEVVQGDEFGEMRWWMSVEVLRDMLFKEGRNGGCGDVNGTGEFSRSKEVLVVPSLCLSLGVAAPGSSFVERRDASRTSEPGRGKVQRGARKGKGKERALGGRVGHDFPARNCNLAPNIDRCLYSTYLPIIASAAPLSHYLALLWKYSATLCPLGHNIT